MMINFEHYEPLSSLFLTPYSLSQRKPIISRSLTKFRNIMILLSTFLCCLIFRAGNPKEVFVASV